MCDEKIKHEEIIEKKLQIVNLKFKKTFKISVIGNSMFPVIQNKDVVTICKMEKYYPGDILAFHYKGELIIHRLLKIENKLFFAKGDNSFRIENFFEYSILGKAIVPNDFNSSTDFLSQSWNIGCLFKKNNYNKELIVKTREYFEYKSKYIDSVYSKKMLLNLRGFISYSKLPIPQNCSYAIIKGDALSLLAYGNYGQRISRDIDILIPKNSLGVFQNTLIENGFKKINSDRITTIYTSTTSHQIVPLQKEIKPFGELLVDLNFDVFWGEYEGERINIEEFLSDCIYKEIYGTKVKVLTPLKAFVQLVLHHYKDLNSIFLLATRKRININMFKDIYCLILNNKEDISVVNLLNISEKYKITPYVYYVLYYTFQLYNDPLLKKYLIAFYSFEGEELLNCYGLCSKERKKWQVDFNTRLHATNLFTLIKDDLTNQDIEKIRLNLKYF